MKKGVLIIAAILAVIAGCSGTILVFDDTAHFREVYECLESEYETWNDDFETLYGGLSEEDYNAIADSLGFDEDATLLGFSTCLSFTSMLAKLREAEETWMDTTVLDMNTDPENEAPTEDEILLALLSRYGEVIIGNVYYRYFPDGTIFEYPDYKCDDIETLRGNPNSNIENVNRVTYGGVETDTCTAWKRNRDEYNYADNKLYKYKVRIRNFLINCTVSAAMTSYKQKPNGNWRKWRANLSTELTGTIRDNACENDGTLYKLKAKRRKSITELVA